MAIESGTAIVLAYVLVSIGVIVAFLWAVFMVGWFIGRRRECRRADSTGKSNLPGCDCALASGAHHHAARCACRV
jgi:hypothetical protein